jgi:hypothetical protein
VKNAGDKLLTGVRSVPPGAGATHAGNVTVNIPGTTPLAMYFLLACADDPNSVVETSEGNNSARPMVGRDCAHGGDQSG